MTLITESLTDKIVKYCGRIGMSAVVADVVQSFFTGKTLNQYLYNSTDFVAYSKDAVLFLTGMVCERAYTSSVNSKKEMQERKEEKRLRE